jgi:hypothetical protein
MIKSTEAFLLAGASALAILACAAEANAETFTIPGMFSFTASVSGEYAVELLGASGGNPTVVRPVVGGLGAEVSGDVFLTAGEDLTLFVGGQGGSGLIAGGGGGGSFVFLGTDVLAVAGGGGVGFSSAGPGLAGTSGGAGGGYGRNGGGAGGANGNGGGAGGVGYGAGGGGSYLASLVTDRVLTAGMNSEGGSISIDLIPAAVPEPSTWALMARGFAGLGLLAHMRKRKLTAV